MTHHGTTAQGGRVSDGEVDFGRRSEEYARFRPGLPTSFYDRIEAIVPFQGIRALDLGTGPAIVALELAARGAEVTAIDIAEGQIIAARSQAAAAGFAPRCTFVVAPAEDTGLDAESFDLVLAAQCWHWFDEQAVMREVLRILKPGGYLVVVHHAYLALHDRVASATEELILEFNPSWPMAGVSGLYPDHIDTLIDGGFALVEQFCYDHDLMYTHESWRGRIRTSNGVGSGPLTEAEVARFDEALADLLRSECPSEPFPMPHRVWATVVRRP